MPFFEASAVHGAAALLLAAVIAQGQSSDCTRLLQVQDVRAVAACKAQLDDAERAPASERMGRIVANDEYGLALLAIAHNPSQSLEPFNRGIAILPASTVKQDSLQYAVEFWHRATAYQQLKQWNQAGADLKIAEDALTRAIADSGGDGTRTEHFKQLRQSVRRQRADVLEHEGKHQEATKLLATQ